MDKKRKIIYPLLLTLTLAIAAVGFTKFKTEGLLIPLLFTAIYFKVIFVIVQIINDNSTVDIGWGMGVVVGSWLNLLVTENQQFYIVLS